MSVSRPRTGSDGALASRLRRTCAAIATVVLAGGAMIMSAATPALAHDDVVSAAPKDGQLLETAPAEVVLEFSGELQVLAGSTPVAVTRPDGTLVEVDQAAIDGAFVRQSLPALDDGEYRVAYRVVSEDGHVITGMTRFFVGEVPDVEPVVDGGADAPDHGAGGEGAPSLEPVADETSAASAASTGSGPWPLTIGLGAAGVVLVGVGLVALRVRRT